MQKKMGLVVALTFSLVLTTFPAMMPMIHASPITLYPIADSWVENKYPTLNHGGDPILHCRSDTHPRLGNVTKRSYLKFDLTGIDPNAIHGAALYLYCTAATIPPDYMDVDVHQTGDNWIEGPAVGDIDWTNAPAVGAYITTTAVDGINQSYSWGGDAMTSYVKVETAGDGIVSFVVKLPSDTVYIHPPMWHRDFSSKEGANRPYLKIFARPVACFTVSNYSPNTCETVIFNASCSYDPDGIIVKYEWDWEGDGTYDFDAGANPIATHHYAKHGLYYPKLRVTDNEGLTNETYTTVLVRGYPVADFTWTPLNPTVYQIVNFDASVSKPDGGTIVSYMWDFGDGTPVVSEPDPITTHMYTMAGTYNVILTVTDDEGLNDTAKAPLTVYHLHDVAVIDVAPSLTEVYVGEAVTITVIAKNEGTATETFNITVYYNGNIIGIQSVADLAPGSDTVLTFSWTTLGVPVGEYVIKAEASVVPGEIDIEDNTYIDGTVTVKPILKPIRDVAVIGVTPSVTQVDVGQVVNITVTVRNEGTVPENFDVTLYYDDTAIGTQTVTGLGPGAEKTLKFSWDTSDVAEGEYTIKAEASMVPGETDIADNTYVDGTVTVKSSPRELDILAIIVAAAIALTILAILLYRRRRRKQSA